MTQPIAILLARLDSSRLPGKHLLTIGDTPLITHLLNRLKKGANYKIVLATSNRSIDKPLLDWAAEQGVDAFAGDAFDLRKRVMDCVKYFQATCFARVNADSPFVDNRLLEDAFAFMAKHDVDLYTNLFPRSFPYGYSVEVFNSLSFINALKDNSELENITTHFYTHANQFKIHNVNAGLQGLSNIRMTVDTSDDLDILRALFKSYPNLFEYSLEQLVPLFQNRTV